MVECAYEDRPRDWGEIDRLASLRSFGILDTEPEAQFDDIASVAAEVCHAPIAAVNFIDERRQWSKAIAGLDIRETPLDVSICAHAIRQPDLFVVRDTLEDPTFRDNPIVTGEPGVRFYAGAVLLTAEGLPLGTLCVADTQPRPQGITQGQARTLRVLARAIMQELTHRRNNGMLIERERDLAAIIDSLPQMVRIAGPDGHHEYRNRRYHEFIGATQGRVEGEAWKKVVHPEDRDQAWARWRHSLQTGEPYETEYRLRHHSGEYRWVLARAIPDYDSQGRISRWFGTSLDVHAWKLAEQALAESEERYRALVEATTAMVWRADADGSILLGWGWQAFTGQPPEEYGGHGWLTVVHPQDQPDLITTWRAALASGVSAGSDFRVRHRGGEYRWVHSRAVPLRAPDGSIREWVGTITNIHERKEAEDALRTSEERLRLALEATGLGIWDADLVTGYREWTQEAKDILGLAPETATTRETFLERIHSDDRDRIEAKFFASVPESIPIYQDECRMFRADTGEERWVAVSGRTFLDDTGMAVRKLGTIQDITDRKRAEDALRDSEARLQLALQAARMVAWEQDTRTDYITRSENSLALLGVGSGPLKDFLARVPTEDRGRRDAFIANVHAKASDTMEFRYALPDGRSLWLASRAQKAGPHRVVGVTFDISDRKAVEEKIWRVANHDPLTGLPSRRLFQHRLEAALERAKQHNSHVSLLLIDLDDFKEVNDSMGHDAGDALLAETAARLSEMMRECDTVARLGGDEFAVIVVEPLKLCNALNLADSIIRRIRQPFTYNGRTILSRTSIGVAAYPDHDSEPTELVKDADIALYRAKAEGRSRVVAYSPVMRAAAEQRLTLTREVREAVGQDEFIPFYQPKICLRTGSTIGLEALARWQHPQRGILTPATFGEAFDDSELATVLSKRLIGKVVSDIRRWLEAGFNPGRVAVNLSSSEFNQPDLAADILHLLALAKIPTKHFEVEVTERVLLDGRSDQVAATLRELRRHGVQIALDDFGTGYASLTHLKQFPVDHIKIDQSFVQGIELDEDDRAIVSAVIGLGKNLDLLVTAEGVEAEGQVRRIRSMGCDCAQGYHFAKPMPADQVARFLTRLGSGAEG